MTTRANQFLYAEARNNVRSDAPRADQPKAGFYQRRLVKGGPFVPIKIEHSIAKDPETGEALDRSPMWLAWLNGEEVEVFSVWPECSGNPITEDEYNFLLAKKTWAERHDRSAPEANPRKPIDLNALPPLF